MKVHEFMPKKSILAAGQVIAICLMPTLGVCQEYLSDVREVDRNAVLEIRQVYLDECRAAQGQKPVDATLTDGTVYDIVIDDEGTKATVVYTDFSCSDLGPIWCGTGGCDSYLIVNGKTFEWRVSFPPYTLQIPNPYTPTIRTAILFPLYGAYCKTAKQVQGYGQEDCYEIVQWSGQRKTFMSRSGSLIEFDPLRP